MERSIAVFLALSVCLAQCASIRGKDHPHEPIHKRGKRSCHVCDDNGPRPPPPLFYSLQYNGLARSNDGAPQGIFSGAAADFGGQEAGQSYSVASSVANSGDKLAVGAGTIVGTGKAARAGATLDTAGQSSVQTLQQSSGRHLENVDGGNADASGYGQKKISGSGSFKEAHYSFSSDGSKRFDGRGATRAGLRSEAEISGSQDSGNFNGANRAGSGSEAEISGSQGSRNFNGANRAGSGSEAEISGSQGSRNFNGAGRAGSGSEAEISGSQGSGNFNGGAQVFERQSSGSSGYTGNEQHREQDGFGHGHRQGFAIGRHDVKSLRDKGQQVQTAGNGHWQQNYDSNQRAQDAGSSILTPDFGARGYRKSGHSALKGALNLASQGLQTAQQTGCDTCGRSSYALSNAKSKTGDAVAVSIGG